MATFYRLDGTKLTLAEYWRLSPEPLSFLIAAGLKLLGYSPFNFTIPRPDRLFVVELDELPLSVRVGMGPAIHAAQHAGLRLVFCHRLAVVERHRLGAAAILLDEPGEIALSVMYGRHGQAEERQLTCSSILPDGTRAVTTTMRKTLEPVPGNRAERHPGADATTLLARHRGHLHRLAGEGLVPTPLDPDKLPDTVLGWELSYVDFHIGRGVFVPMTVEEVDRLAGRRGE